MIEPAAEGVYWLRCGDRSKVAEKIGDGWKVPGYYDLYGGSDWMTWDEMVADYKATAIEPVVPPSWEDPNGRHANTAAIKRGLASLGDPSKLVSPTVTPLFHGEIIKTYPPLPDTHFPPSGSEA